ncbi:MAG: RNA-binding protein [Sphingobacteriales bacterium]|nr:MAG: RNA-binding protein [Sphingobacteriales bacterium]
MNIFIGNLNFQTTEPQLHQLFASFGTVTTAKVIRDEQSGRSRGFGFVEMEDDTAARAAITALHNMNFMDRFLTVNEARSKPRASGAYKRPATSEQFHSGDAGLGEHRDN